MSGSDTRSSQLIKLLILITVPIIMWRFYWYVGFDQKATSLMSFILSAFLVVYLFVIWVNGNLRYYSEGSLYSRLVLLILFNVFLSMINAYAYWGQGIVLTFRAGYIFFIIIYFFLLYSTDVSYDDIVRLVLFFSFVYLLLWLYAVSQSPQVVFGNYDEVSDDRGFARIINLSSVDLVYLAYFISLVKVSSGNSENKLVWIGVLVVSLLLIIGTLTRTVIVATILVSGIYLLRRRPGYLIIVVIVTIVASGYLVYNEVASSLFDLTYETFEFGPESALRIVEYTQFADFYPFNIGTFLFGNGSPHVESDYGAFEEFLKSDYFFNRSDAGPVGMYVSFGIVSIVLFTIVLIRVIKQKVSDDAMPFKLFVIFLFIINLTSWKFFKFGISFMICLYILDLDHKSGYLGLRHSYYDD